MTPSAEVVLPNPVFEGSEKRVEIDFVHAPDSHSYGLRKLTREQLDELMTLAACTIVSSRSNADFDAYVLSESSLFVYPTKWILKTCGTTKLLNSIPRLLELTHSLGLMPSRCKFTRATYLFPENQPAPHSSFKEEVQFLDGYFGHLGGGGQAAVLGDAEYGLQWHVYVADAKVTDQSLTPRPTYNVEVCMTELGRPAALQFYRSEKTATEVTKDTGIALLKPKAIIDDYIFDPCGYSMNGIDGTGLITIHITPEAGFSYASVEVSGFWEDVVEPSELLSMAVKIFQPGKISLALTVDRPETSLDKACREFGTLFDLPSGYNCFSSTSQALPGGGSVVYYNLATDRSTSPVSILHHTVSCPCVSDPSASDSDGDADMSWSFCRSISAEPLYALASLPQSGVYNRGQAGSGAEGN